VSTGLQNKEVAQKLEISLATARNHVHNILEKLEVHSKLEAVSLAFRRGWVTNQTASATTAGDSRCGPSRGLRRLA
jgi:Bacterial regulatory proteins, luxR family